MVFLYQQGKSMRQVAFETGTCAATVHKVIAEVISRTRVVYLYMDREEPVTLIDACSAVRRIKILNFTDDLISRAFGIRTEPTWEDYEAFLETRCMPRTRYGIQEELENMGLDFYDPVLIIEKTKGRVYEDSQWLWKMDEQWIKRYDTAAKQAEDKEELKRRVLKLLEDMEEVVSDGTGKTSSTEEECRRKIKAKPFSRDFDEQLDACELLFPEHPFRAAFAIEDVTAVLEEFRGIYEDTVLHRVEDTMRMQIRKYGYMF